MAQRGLYHGSVVANYRKILADNVAALMRENPDLGSHAKLAAAMRKIGPREFGPRTIGHLLNAQQGPQPQLDTIVAVAKAFKVEPWMLLREDFDASSKRAGELIPPEVVRIARTIVDLEPERRKLLMEIFAAEGAPDREGARVVHEASARHEAARHRKK